MSKSYKRLDSVGYLSGQIKSQTYGINGMDFRRGMEFRDSLRAAMGIDARFKRCEDDPSKIELLFDLTED